MRTKYEVPDNRVVKIMNIIFAEPSDNPEQVELDDRVKNGNELDSFSLKQYKGILAKEIKYDDSCTYTLTITIQYNGHTPKPQANEKQNFQTQNKKFPYGKGYNRF